MKNKRDDIGKPFLKWAGGKTQLINSLTKMFPKQLANGTIKTYVEPFVGGGAVLFHILQTYNIKKAYINDINDALINCYQCIKTDISKVIELLETIQNKYFSAHDKAKYFYTIRDVYNKHINEQKLNYQNCAYFIFLNKTCFNGLYRVNSHGKFNVPFGKYKNPLICDKNNLMLCSKLLKNVIIRCGNYQQILNKIDGNTFVYFDPPYRPLTKSSFVSYARNGFDDSDQDKLAYNYKLLNDTKQCKLMLSNSDPKNSNKEDNYFDQLYKNFKIERVMAKRAINCCGTKRGNITEIVVTNY